MIKRETFENTAEALKYSAFPARVEATVVINGKPENFTAFSVGMSKRELFAAMAMSNAELKTIGKYSYNGINEREEHLYDAKQVAECSVRYADALLAELSKESK